MTFRQAMIALRPRLSAREQQRLDRFTAAAARSPRLWKTAEQLVAHAYERRTGKRLVGTIDWQTIWAWFIANGPMILQLILSILTIFATAEAEG